MDSLPIIDNDELLLAILRMLPDEYTCIGDSDDDETN
mgnify:CR=1 FL=1